MADVLTELIELQDSQSETFQPDNMQAEFIYGFRVGKVVLVNEIGKILVDYTDNPFDALVARSTVNITPEENREILIAFENNNPQLPIIVGIIQDQPIASSKGIMLDKSKVKDIIVDSERILFDAKKEIVLRCGKGSITIQKDGKIVIRGTNLLSRSKGMNKIKGAAVSIN